MADVTSMTSLVAYLEGLMSTSCVHMVVSILAISVTQPPLETFDKPNKIITLFTAITTYKNRPMPITNHNENDLTTVFHALCRLPTDQPTKGRKTRSSVLGRQILLVLIRTRIA